MYLVVTDSSEEFARLKLTLGRGLKQVKDRRELTEFLTRDPQHSYSLVIIGSAVELATALSISEDLRVTFPTIGAILLRSKVDSIVTTQSMSAGIREVVHINDPEAIVVACKKSEEISRRQLQNFSQKLETTTLGKIIVFHAPKDGLGVTTIASNIGTDLSHRKGLQACLVDSAQMMGDLAVRFRIEVLKSWLDLTSVQDIDDQALSSVISKTKFGVDLLLSPRDIPMDSRDDISSFNQVIRALQQKYHYVLIDMDSRFDEWNRNLLYLAHHIVLVTTLDLSTLKNVKVRLKEISNLDVPTSLISLFLNGGDRKVGIKPEDVPELLGLELSANLPWDVDVTRFANEGTPIVIAKERSGITHSIQHAADQLIDRITASQQESTKTRSRSRKSA